MATNPSTDPEGTKLSGRSKVIPEAPRGGIYYGRASCSTSGSVPCRWTKCGTCELCYDLHCVMVMVMWTKSAWTYFYHSGHSDNVNFAYCDQRWLLLVKPQYSSDPSNPEISGFAGFFSVGSDFRFLFVQLKHCKIPTNISQTDIFLGFRKFT